MKKLCKFMLGCLGLICEAIIPIAPAIISILLFGYVSTLFAFTFIITFPLSLYLIKVVYNLNCTDKFVEWVFEAA